MRILHLTPSYHPATGGAETFTKEVSERLARRSHSVTILTLRDGAGADARAASPPKERVNGVDVKRFPAAGRSNDLLRLCVARGPGRRVATTAIHPSTLDLWANSAYGLTPFRLTLQSKADIVAVINWYDGWLPRQAELARRIRRFSLVGVPLFHTECEWARRGLFSDLLRACDAVAAMTEHERQFVQERARGAVARAVGVGINPEEFERVDEGRVRRQYAIGDVPVVGYVGRMVPSKGVATLIRAMRTVWRARPEVRLLLAGPGLPPARRPGDPISDALTALSADERLRVILVGPFGAADKGAIFRAMDLFAMPSSAESFGIAYLEAWTCGTPVIGSRIASTACVINDGVDGLLVTPGDPEELGAAMLGLLANPGRRQAMGRAGRCKTLAHFTWDRVADRVERLYLDASGRGSA